MTLSRIAKRIWITRVIGILSEPNPLIRQCQNVECLKPCNLVHEILINGKCVIACNYRCAYKAINPLEI